MSTLRTIRVTETLSAVGIALAKFGAAITVNIQPEYGDGFNEPREPTHAEFASVEQISGVHIEPAALADWASEWVDASQDAIMRYARDGKMF